MIDRLLLDVTELNVSQIVLYAASETWLSKDEYWLFLRGVKLRIILYFCGSES